ncbi:MAG: hypothetical protein CL675_12360 [Bdellovibrionaceae bacterium]|nr:hypothetical protein [Pseudobdellovibrionaceae bacterium]
MLLKLKNTTKVWFLIFSISFFLIVAGHQSAGRDGLLWAFAISVIVFNLLYFYSVELVSQYFKAEPIEGQDPWRVLLMTQELARKSNIPFPDVKLIPSPALQAFSVGRNEQHSQIYLTTGLVETLETDELRAVIAHQVCAIQRNDSTAYATLSTIISALLYVPHQFDRALCWSLGINFAPEKNKGRILSKVVTPVIFLLSRFVQSKASLHHLDEEAAELIGNPLSVAKAIWRIGCYTETLPYPAAPAVSSLFFVNPLAHKNWTRSFANHPSPEQRIRHLLGYYPI